MAGFNNKNIFLAGLTGATGERALNCFRSVADVSRQNYYVGAECDMRFEYFDRTPKVGDVFVTYFRFTEESCKYLYLTLCLVTSVDSSKAYFTIKSMKSITGPQGETGATGAKLVSQVFQGSDDKGGNIYLQTFDDGTTATFTAPTGDEVGPWIDVAYRGESEPIEYGAVYEVLFENVDLFQVCFMDDGSASTTMNCRRNEFTRIQKEYTENWVEGDPDGNWNIYNSYLTVVLSKDTMKMHLELTYSDFYITTDGTHVGGVPKHYSNQAFKYRRIR